MMIPTIRIQTNEIPVADATVLARTFLSAVNTFYRNPQNVLKFEEWKKQQNKKHENIKEVY